MPRSEPRSVRHLARWRPTSFGAHALYRARRCEPIHAGAVFGSTRERLRPPMQTPRNHVPRRFWLTHPPCERGRDVEDIATHTPPRSAGGFQPKCDTDNLAMWLNSARESLSAPRLPGAPRYPAPDERSSRLPTGRPRAASPLGKSWRPVRRHAPHDRCGLQDELGWPCRQSPLMPVPTHPERSEHSPDAAIQRTRGRRSSPVSG